MKSRKALRRRYGRSARHGETMYRGYKLLSSTVIQGGTTIGYEVDVMKKGYVDAPHKNVWFTETTVKDVNQAKVNAKAKRVVAAMKGD